MGFLADLRQLLHPYYIFNIFLSLSYITSKLIPQVCSFIFRDECGFDMREGEILFFLLIIVMVRARKTGSMGIIAYLTNSFMYAKVANAVLWFLESKSYGFIFLFFFLLQGLLLPQPVYSGPDRVLYFRDEKLFKEEVEKKGTVWLVEFYAAWNPSCVNFAPVFAELSQKYALSNLMFGKVDVGRLPDLAHQYSISDSPFSKQLPSLILYKGGKAVMIRPTGDSGGRLIKFHMTMESIVTAFDLNNLHAECRAKLKNPTLLPSHEKEE